MTQLEKDIKLLKEKYAGMKAIPTAEAILRVVEFAEKHKDKLTYKVKEPV